MSNVRISQLPTAPSAITGAELVPIVQNGQTVHATISQLVASPSQTQTFLTVNNEPTLPNSRYVSSGVGIGHTDSGAQGAYSFYLNGTSGSLEVAGTGIIAKTAANTITARTISVSGAGLSVTNGDGVSGNPTLAASGLLYALANASGTGLLTINGSNISNVVLQGTTNQISVTNADGSAGYPTFSIAANPVIPGTASLTLPAGGVASRPVLGVNGMIRYNSDAASLEAYANNAWGAIISGSGVATFSAGTTGFTPNTPTAGGIILGGKLNVNSGGTGATTLTGYVYGNGTSAMTASITIPTTDLSGTVTNAQIANPQVTYNGVTVALGASGTITATATNALTIGTGLSGTSYNGSTAVTIAIDSTVATLTGIQTLTNKSISGSTNTFTNIPNSGLTNSSLTIGATNIALGGTSLTLGGLTSVTVTQDPISGLQLATKQYVDAVAQGLNVKPAVLLATTANITLSGEQSIDGFTTSSSRVLVKNQSTQANNGIYVSNASTWTRAVDAATWAQLISAFVFVEQGTTQADTGWVCTVDPGGTLGVTAVTWTQFSGAGTYTAGTGLTLTGSQFSLTAPVTTALGGTGSTSALTQYGVVYGSTTSAMATTLAGTSTQVLHGNASGAPTWSAVSLTADVTGTLPIASGGTNSTATPTAGGVGYGTGTAHAYSAVGTSGQILTSAGAGTPTWSTLSSVSVTTLSFGTTGLTPATATSGAITVAGTLVVGNGGTGVATLTGLAYGNGASAFTAATAAQVVAVISTTAVTNATNAANLNLAAGSGATNYITYAATATGNVPQYTSTGLTYNATNTALTGGINGGTF